MAAVALQDTTLQQLEKIIEVVGQKSVSLVEGIKTSVAPKLNETIAQVIDDFKSGGLVKQKTAIEMLMEQMKKLGLSVDDLSKSFKGVEEVPAGLKSLITSIGEVRGSSEVNALYCNKLFKLLPWDRLPLPGLKTGKYSLSLNLKLHRFLELILIFNKRHLLVRT